LDESASDTLAVLGRAWVLFQISKQTDARGDLQHARKLRLLPVGTQFSDVKRDCDATEESGD
tara:strand:+ start:4141 stop:4326 length:186 start_codon:yes stop_codon:yes gene_type:complete